MTATHPDINEILARPANNASSKYGADMGRRSQAQGVPEKLHLQRLRWVDGDYDTGGAYWGGGTGSAPIWCAFSPDDTQNDPPIRVFVRAKDRKAAEARVLEELSEEGFTFVEDFAIDEMVQGYVEAALFFSNDNSDDQGGDPLSDNYQYDDLHPDALAKMSAECRAFADAVRAAMPFVLTEADPHDLGSDFWLTRSGTGCGFLDGDWRWLDRDGIDVGRKLSDLAGRRDPHLYVGDDEKVHLD